jgi:hypothetical protein
MGSSDLSFALELDDLADALSLLRFRALDLVSRQSRTCRR